MRGPRPRTASLRLATGLVLAAALVAAGCQRQQGSPDPPPETSPTGGAFERGEAVIETEFGEVRVDVEIAETPEQRQRGLMFREELPPDAGMVFLVEEPSESGFWMKNTLIPLSVAFWGEDGRILAILDMEPCTEDPCPVYDPEVRWSGALEVNQGFFVNQGVRVGDRVSVER